MVANRKKATIGIRTSLRRAQRLREYAVSVEKSLTQVIEEFIDRLPVAKSEVSHDDRI